MSVIKYGSFLLTLLISFHSIQGNIVLKQPQEMEERIFPFGTDEVSYQSMRSATTSGDFASNDVELILLVAIPTFFLSLVTFLGLSGLVYKKIIVERWLGEGGEEGKHDEEEGVVKEPLIGAGGAAAAITTAAKTDEGTTTFTSSKAPLEKNDPTKAINGEGPVDPHTGGEDVEMEVISLDNGTGQSDDSSSE